MSEALSDSCHHEPDYCSTSEWVKRLIDGVRVSINIEVSVSFFIILHLYKAVWVCRGHLYFIIQQLLSAALLLQTRDIEEGGGVVWILTSYAYPSVISAGKRALFCFSHIQSDIETKPVIYIYSKYTKFCSAYCITVVIIS